MVSASAGVERSQRNGVSYAADDYVLRMGAPVDLVFQSIGGTEGTNRSFGFTLGQLAEARDAARALRREPGLRDTFLVALTGYALPEDQRRAADAGFDVHLTKPATMEAVQEIIRRGNPVLRDTDTVLGILEELDRSNPQS